jgi:dTDP-4-amino-4,6-dideoxygalactose transaminase
MRVPLLDLAAQYRELREDLLAAIDQTMASGAWVLGPPVTELEKEIARTVGAASGIGVASGTDAILLALRAAGVQNGEEVICPPFTFFATAGATINAGGKPVFVDIEEDSFNLDPRQLEKAITPRTRAVIPVHLFGQSAEMGPILDVCRSRGIAVIEDAAQSIGATYQDRPVGSLGDAACFSFYPTKNLGGAGDGGMITTSDSELEAKLRILRVHGAKPKYYHQSVGFNSRLDSLQAAILRVKLPHLAGWAKARQARAAIYDDRLGKIDGVKTPPRTVRGEHVYNQYTIRVQRGSRDALQKHLAEQGIGTEIYYPYPLHLLPAFERLGYREGDFPAAERAAKQALSLPISPELQADQQEHVIAAIRAWAEKQ